MTRLLNWNHAARSCSQNHTLWSSTSLQGHVRLCRWAPTPDWPFSRMDRAPRLICHVSALADVTTVWPAVKPRFLTASVQGGGGRHLGSSAAVFTECAAGGGGSFGACVCQARCCVLTRAGSTSIRSSPPPLQGSDRRGY